jgi:hypothetical protein
MLSQVVWHHSNEKVNDVYLKLAQGTDEELHQELFKEIAEGRITFDALGEELFGVNTGGGNSKGLEDIFLRLYAYGAKAVLPQGLGAQDLECAVRFLVFSRCIGELGTGQVPVMCEAVFNLSLSRYKIDFHQGAVDFDWNEGFDWLDSWVKFPEMNCLTIAELSALSQMSEQSIRNELSKGGGGLLTKVDRYGKRAAMRIDVAVDWLKARNGYTGTRKPNVSTGEVQVPVSSDGSVFGPQCRQGAGYKVGAKGEEVYFEGIQQALNALAAMEKPRWRRPNSKGHFGIVTGKSWLSLTQEEWLRDL